MLGDFFCQIIIINKFKVTVCEVDSTISMESDLTLCYYNSDSDNDSVSSEPMFVEDKDKTDDELPDIELPDIEGPCNDVREGAAAYPDAHPVCSHSDKCECKRDNNAKENEVFFYSIFSFFFKFSFSLHKTLMSLPFHHYLFLFHTVYEVQTEVQREEIAAKCYHNRECFKCNGMLIISKA